MLIFVGHAIGHPSSRVKVVLIWSEIKACRPRVNTFQPDPSRHSQISGASFFIQTRDVDAAKPRYAA